MPKTISIITITCRAEPRLEMMASGIRRSLNRILLEQRPVIEWIIVDQRAHDAMEPVPVVPEDDGRFSFRFVPAPVRADGLPAHNSAKNAGLAAARGEYVIFLSDCMLVTKDWVSCALTRARLGQGWRCKQFELADVAPAALARPFNHGAVGQPISAIKPIPASAVGGRCWGAPRRAFLQVQGFDTAFDGEVHGHDVECAIRLGRAGVVFVAPTGAAAVRLRRTALATTNSKEARRGTRNQRLLAQLAQDRHRTLPLKPSAFGLESSEALTLAPEDAIAHGALAGAGAGDDQADPAAGAPPAGLAGAAAPAAAADPDAAALGRGPAGPGGDEAGVPDVPGDPGRRDDARAALAGVLSTLDLSDLGDLFPDLDAG